MEPFFKPKRTEQARPRTAYTFFAASAEDLKEDSRTVLLLLLGGTLTNAQKESAAAWLHSASGGMAIAARLMDIVLKVEITELELRALCEVGEEAMRGISEASGARFLFLIPKVWGLGNRQFFCGTNSVITRAIAHDPDPATILLFKSAAPPQDGPEQFVENNAADLMKATDSLSGTLGGDFTASFPGILGEDVFCDAFVADEQLNILPDKVPERQKER